MTLQGVQKTIYDWTNVTILLQFINNDRIGFCSPTSTRWILSVHQCHLIYVYGEPSSTTSPLILAAPEANNFQRMACRSQRLHPEPKPAGLATFGGLQGWYIKIEVYTVSLYIYIYTHVYIYIYMYSIYIYLHHVYGFV